MPIISSVDRAKQLTIHTARGEITTPDIQACLETFYQDPTRDVLWDLREASMSQVSGKDMERFAEYLIAQAPLRPRGKTALVAPEDLEYGTIRMGMGYVGDRGPITYNVFRTMDQAKAWLDSG